jgi:mannosyltransferase OCH1-like enzyme
MPLWIWTNDDIKLRLELAAYPKLFSSAEDRIKILLYHPRNLSMGTALEGRYDILEGNDVIATKADIMRVLILNHYDGIYIDLDSLFLQA